MGLDVAPIGSPSFSTAPDRAPRDSRAEASDSVSISSGDIPAGPPPEVLEAVDAAGRAYRELHAQGRELHFEPRADGGRVRIEVRDLDGNTLREIPPSDVLDVASGAPVE